MIYTYFRKGCVIVNFPKNFVKDSDDFVRYLIKCSQLFGLVKYTRKRHREIDAYILQIWALSSEIDTNKYCCASSAWSI